MRTGASTMPCAPAAIIASPATAINSPTVLTSQRSFFGPVTAINEGTTGQTPVKKK